VVYLLAGFFMFGLPVLTRSSYLIGYGADPQIFIWALAWWPHAILHGLDPINTHALYYPDGLDLAHGAMVPAAALLLAPVTAVLGPVGAYNVGMVLSPALAATFAFLLCRRLTRSFWASLVGGWLFGFSPYMLGQMAGHLHLTLVFLVPAIVHLALRGWAGELRGARLVIPLGVVLACQLYISAEVLVSTSLWGVVALAVAYGLGDGTDRARMLEFLPGLALACVLAGILCAPYLVEAFQPGAVPASHTRTDVVSADLLSYLLPSPLTRLGGLSFQRTTAKFTEGLFEGGAYVSIPVIVMAALGAYTGRRTLAVKVAVSTLIVIVVCSFGGHLHVGGASTIPMPWAALDRLPILGQLLPARFSDDVFLIVALLAASWLARARTPSIAAVLAALAIVFAWPALSTGPWKSPTGLPPLFATTAYRSYIKPHDVVAVLPIGSGSPSMLWQAVADFRFALVGGYALPPEAPNPYTDDPLYPQLTTEPSLRAGPAVSYFLAHHGVTLALMEPLAPTTPRWETLLERLGWHGAVHGGVLIMRHRVQ